MKWKYNYIQELGLSIPVADPGIQLRGRPNSESESCSEVDRLLQQRYAKKTFDVSKID